MKTIIRTAIALMFLFFLTNEIFAQEKSDKCSQTVKVPALKNTPSRGEEVFNPGSVKLLSLMKPALSRGMADCLITIFNKFDYEVNVYIDTVWQGTLEPKKKGYIIPEKGSYSYMHAISLAGEYKWAQKGDCVCNRMFQLVKPSSESESKAKGN